MGDETKSPRGLLVGDVMLFNVSDIFSWNCLVFCNCCKASLCSMVTWLIISFTRDTSNSYCFGLKLCSTQSGNKNGNTFVAKISLLIPSLLFIRISLKIPVKKLEFFVGKYVKKIYLLINDKLI